MRHHTPRWQGNDVTRTSREGTIATRRATRRGGPRPLQLEPLEDRTLLSLVATTTELSASVTNPVYGQAETYTATVDPTVLGQGVPTGTVTFYDGGIVLGTAMLSAASQGARATLTTSSLTAGAHTITATYSGDTNFDSSTSQYGLGFSPVSEVSVPNGRPWGIVTGRDGNLWFTENPLNAVGRYDPASGQLLSYTIPTANSQPCGIVVGPDGALWFAEAGGDKIGRVDPSSGNITEYKGPSPGSLTQQIAAGPLNSIWFSEQNSDQIGRIDVTTGQVTQYAIPTPNSQPSGLTEGPDGAIWFTENGVGQIGRIDPATGQITEYVIPTVGSAPVWITTGPDGALWFSESGAGQIGRLDLATQQITEFTGAGAGPWGIIAAPDGDLWFSEETGAAIGRLDPVTGQITQFTGQTFNTALGIAVGPDGGIWSAEFGKGALAHVPFGTTLTVQPAATSTALATSTLILVSGQPVTFTATVEATAPGAGSPTGTVTFYDGSTELGTETLTLSGGVPTATFTTSTLGVGVHSISAVYGGDLDFSSGERHVGVQVRASGSLLADKTELSASVPAPVYCQAETFTAFVTPVTGIGVPTGIVTFSDGDTVLGTATLATSNEVTSASLTTSSLTAGAHTITATYSGDTNFDSSTSQYGLCFSPVVQVTAPGSAAWGVVTGPDHALWFTENGIDSIGRYDPATAQLASFPVPTPNSGPVGITVGPDGAIWFAEYSDQIGRIDPNTDQITEYKGLPSGSGVQQISSGPLNSIWFTEQWTNEVGRIDVTTGQITQYPIPTADSQPSGITEGPDGAMWFAEFGAGRIGRLDPSDGTITEYAIPTVGSAPVQITTGPDGALWFTESGTNQIGRIDPTTDQISEFADAGSSPWGIVTGPDGGLWFSEQGSSNVGRIDPATGQSVQIAGAGSALGITVGPDGNIWLAENVASSLGRVPLGTSLTVGRSTTTTTLAASTMTPIYGQPVTLTATIQPPNSTVLPPTGDVTFFDGTTQLGSATLVTSGGVTTATFTTASLGVGSHALYANYGGDGNFTTSTSRLAGTTPLVGATGAWTLTTVAGNGTAAPYSGEGGPATSATLWWPAGVAVDSQGDLFVADTNSELVLKVAPDGTITTAMDLTPFGDYPIGIAVSPTGDLLVAGYVSGQIYELTPGGANSSTFVPIVPTGLAVDGQGNVFITDTGGTGVWKIAPDGTASTELIPGPYATAIAVDSAGDVFVAANFQNQVLEVKPDGTTSVVANVLDPTGVVVDDQGDVFVASGGANAVFEVFPNGNMVELTPSSLGFSDTQDQIPTGMAFDSAGNLFFADAGNGVVDRLGAPPLTVQPLTAANLQSSLAAAPQGSPFTLQASSSTDLNTALQAIAGLTNANPSSPETVALDLAGSTTTPAAPITVPSGVQLDLTSSTGTATAQGVTIDGGTVFVVAGVTPTNWTVNGGNVTVSGSATAGDFVVNGGTVTLSDGTVITGHSPAFTLNGGTLNLDNVTANTDTASPTILVTGGTLTVRGSTIDSSTGDAEPAILMTGGSVDLGTAASPGGNILNANGLGELVHNTTASLVPDVGNTYEQNGNALPAASLSFTTLATSAPIIGPTQSVTFTATVRPDDPGTPTGSVDFYDTTTGTDLGAAPLSGLSARLTVPVLSPGTHIITATYSGDSNDTFSVDSLTQIVNPPQIVTTTADSGTGSLRQAILNVNAEAGPGAIEFNITSIPDGAQTSYGAQDPGAFPAGIATDPNGLIWYTERSGNAIVSFNPATSAANKYALAADSESPMFLQAAPDGSLWFTEDGSKTGSIVYSVGQVLTAAIAAPSATVPTQERFTLPGGVLYDAGATLPATLPVGTIIEYKVPSGNQSWGLTFAPSPLAAGTPALWFSETPDNILGSLSLAAMTVGSQFVPSSYETVTTPDGTVYSSGNPIGAGTVLPKGTVTEMTVDMPQGRSGGIGGLALGPDGNVWAASVSGVVDRAFVSATTIAAVPSNAYIVVPAAQSEATETNTVDSLGFSLGSMSYVVQPGTTNVTLPAGSVEVYDLGTQGTTEQPYSVGFDGGGHLWVGERNGSQLVQLDTTHGATTVVPLAGLGFVSSFSAGRDGNLWFTELNGGRIGRIDPAGHVAEVYTTSGAGPAGITVGPDGNLWFAEYVGDAIAQLAPTTITPNSPLPALTNSVVIDGTQPGAPAKLVVVLDGSQAGVGASGLTLAAGSDGSTVQGLVIDRFAQNAIVVQGSGNDVIQNNGLGTDVIGNSPMSLANGNAGVLVTGTAGAGTIAGDTFGANAGGQALVQLPDSSSLTLQADAGNPARSDLTVTGTSGTNTISLTPGAAPGSVAVTVNGQGPWTFDRAGGTAVDLGTGDMLNVAAGVSQVSVFVPGDFGGSILGSAAGFQFVTIGGVLTASGVVKVGSLGTFSTAGDMAGLLRGFGPGTNQSPTIGTITVGGNFTGTISAVVGAALGTINLNGSGTNTGTIVEDDTHNDLKALNVAGSFDGTVNVASAGDITVQGDLGGTVTASGPIGSLDVVNGTLSGAVQALSIGSVNVDQGITPTGQVSASQSLGTVTVAGTLAGSVSAATITSLSIGGGVAATAQVSATQSLGALSVSGPIAGSVTATNMTLTAVCGAGVHGGTATLTARLTLPDGTPVAGQPVAFTLNGTAVGSALTDTNGVATLTGVSLAGLDAGMYPIVATLDRTGSDVPPAANGTMAVGKDQTSTTLTLPSSDPFGMAVTLKATVAVVVPGAGTPSGSVVFTDQTTGVTLGSAVLSGGVANLTTTRLPVGANAIVATYAGDNNDLGSASNPGSVAIVGGSVFVLDRSAAGALSLSGNATLNAGRGIVDVDSTSSSAIRLTGNAQLTAQAIDVVGGAVTNGNARLSPAPTTGSVAALGDPLAGLPQPAAGTSLGAVTVGGNTSASIGPGTYSAIQVSGNGKLSLAPGTYVIQGGSFTVSGNASVTGTGVLIDIAVGNGGSSGSLNLSGNGTFKLTPQKTGQYAGILVMQAADDRRALALSGNAVAALGGAVIDAPSALLAVSGNGQLGASLVVDALQISGNAYSSLTTGDDSTSASAGQLLAGNIELYVDNSNGDLNPDELARVADAVAAWDAVLAPYGQAITEVSSADQANLMLAMAATSAAGGYAQGALGCYDPGTGITIVQGWSFYAGSSAAGIGVGQYDFESVVLHELGHALGLGHNLSDPTSVMFATLSAGQVRRLPATADLGVSDPPGPADALHATGSAAAPAHQLPGLAAVAPVTITTSATTATPTSGQSLASFGSNPSAVVTTPLRLTIAEHAHLMVRANVGDAPTPNARLRALERVLAEWPQDLPHSRRGVQTEAVVALSADLMDMRIVGNHVASSATGGEEQMPAAVNPVLSDGIPAETSTSAGVEDAQEEGHGWLLAHIATAVLAIRHAGLRHRPGRASERHTASRGPL